MNSKELGADRVFAWPAAEIGIMAPAHAVEIIHRADLARAAERDVAHAHLATRYHEAHVAAAAALRHDVIDRVIAPRQTRATLASSLATLTRL